MKEYLFKIYHAILNKKVVKELTAYQIFDLYKKEKIRRFDSISRNNNK